MIWGAQGKRRCAPPSTMTMEQLSVMTAQPLRWFSVAFTSTLNRCRGLARLPTCRARARAQRLPIVEMQRQPSGAPPTASIGMEWNVVPRRDQSESLLSFKGKVRDEVLSALSPAPFQWAPLLELRGHIIFYHGVNGSLTT